MTSFLRRSFRAALSAAAVAALVAACSGVGSTPAPTAAGSPAGSLAPPASTGGGTGSQACPTEAPDPLPEGETRTVTIETSKGTIVTKIDGSLAPNAAGNFVALAECGFYDGVVFHRLVPNFVIQGGDPTGTGSGGPGYEFDDEKVEGDYLRGTLAMANAGPNTNGSQFFIVLDDLLGRLAKNYTIFGEVVEGMDVVDAIAAMPNSGQPNNEALEPVAMDKVTVTNP